MEVMAYLHEVLLQATMAQLMGAIDLLPDPEFHHLGAEDVYLELEQALWVRRVVDPRL